MEYTPEEVQRSGIGEVLPSDIGALTDAAIVRRLRIIGFETQGKMFAMKVESPAVVLTIPSNCIMSFGRENPAAKNARERITAKEYLCRVLENGDMIDAVVMPQCNGVFPINVIGFI